MESKKKEQERKEATYAEMAEPVFIDFWL